jgi:hypothetical protein
MDVRLVDLDAFDSVTTRAIVQPNCDTQALLDARVALSIRERIASLQKREVVHIPVALTEKSLRLLEDTWREYKIDNTVDSNHSHGVPAACMLLEYAYLRTLANAKQLPVIDVEGKPSLNVRHSDNIHTCLSLFDGRAAVRYQQQRDKLELLTKNGSRDVAARAQTALLTPNNRYLCHRHPADCHVPGASIILAHRCYDYPLTAQARIMIAHGAKRLFGCFHWENQMLVQDSGESEPQGFSWEKKIEYCGYHNGRPVHPLGWEPCNSKYTGRLQPLFCHGHTVVNYFFQDDPSLGYKHSFPILAEIVTRSSFSLAGSFFQVELHTNRLGTQFYSITRGFGSIPLTIYSHRLSLPKQRDTRMVRVFQFRYHHRESAQVQTRIRLYPSALVDSVLSYCYDHPNDKLRLNELCTFISGTNSTQIQFGQTMSYRKKVTADQIIELALSCHLYGIIKKAEQQRLLDGILAYQARRVDIALSKSWSLGTWCQSLVAWVSQLFSPKKKKIDIDYSVGDFELPTYSTLTRAIANEECWDEVLPFIAAARTEITFEEIFSATTASDLELIADRRGQITSAPLDLPELTRARLLLTQYKPYPSKLPDEFSRLYRATLLRHLIDTEEPDFYYELLPYHCSFGPLLLGFPEYQPFYQLPAPADYKRGALTFEAPSTDWPTVGSDRIIGRSLSSAITSCLESKDYFTLTEILAAQLNRPAVFRHIDVPVLLQQGFSGCLLGPNATLVANSLAAITSSAPIDFEVYCRLINAVNDHLWLDYTKTSYPFTILKHVLASVPSPATQGFLIGAELMHQLVFEPTRCLFLGEAPGFFVQAFSEFFPLERAIVSSLEPHEEYVGSFSPAFIKCQKFTACAGDILNPDFSDQVHVHAGAFDTIFCDATPPVGRLGVSEDVYLPYLLSALAVARDNLLPGGTLVLRTYNHTKPISATFLRELCLLFSVSLFRPSVIAPYTSHRYFICTNFTNATTNPRDLRATFKKSTDDQLSALRSLYDLLSVDLQAPVYDNSPSIWCDRYLRPPVFHTVFTHGVCYPVPPQLHINSGPSAPPSPLSSPPPPPPPSSPYVRPPLHKMGETSLPNSDDIAPGPTFSSVPAPSPPKYPPTPAPGLTPPTVVSTASVTPIPSRPPVVSASKRRRLRRYRLFDRSSVDIPSVKDDIAVESLTFGSVEGRHPSPAVSIPQSDQFKLSEDFSSSYIPSVPSPVLDPAPPIDPPQMHGPNDSVSLSSHFEELSSSLDEIFDLTAYHPVAAAPVTPVSSTPPPPTLGLHFPLLIYAHHGSGASFWAKDIPGVVNADTTPEAESLASKIVTTSSLDSYLLKRFKLSGFCLIAVHLPYDDWRARYNRTQHANVVPPVPDPRPTHQYLVDLGCFLKILPAFPGVELVHALLDPPVKRTLVYAFPGSGKTTWGASQPHNHLVVDTDDLPNDQCLKQQVVLTNYYHESFLQPFRDAGFFLVAVYIPDDIWLPRFSACDRLTTQDKPWFDWRKTANRKLLESRFDLVVDDFSQVPLPPYVVPAFKPGPKLAIYAAPGSGQDTWAAAKPCGHFIPSTDTVPTAPVSLITNREPSFLASCRDKGYSLVAVHLSDPDWSHHYSRAGHLHGTSAPSLRASLTPSFLVSHFDAVYTDFRHIILPDAPKISPGPRLLVYALPGSGKTSWAEALPPGVSWVEGDSTPPESNFSTQVVVTSDRTPAFLEKYRAAGFLLVAVRLPGDLWTRRCLGSKHNISGLVQRHKQDQSFDFSNEFDVVYSDFSQVSLSGLPPLPQKPPDTSPPSLPVHDSALPAPPRSLRKPHLGAVGKHKNTNVNTLKKAAPYLAVPVDEAPISFSVIHYTDLIRSMSDAELRTIPQQQLSNAMAEPLCLHALCEVFRVDLNWVNLSSPAVTYIHSDIAAPSIFVYQAHAYVYGERGSSPDVEKLFPQYFTRHGAVSMPPDGDCVYHAARALYPDVLPDIATLRNAVAGFYNRSRAGGRPQHLLAVEELIRYWKKDEKYVTQNIRYQWARIWGLPLASADAVHQPLDKFQTPSEHWLRVFNEQDEGFILYRTTRTGRDRPIYKPLTYDTSGEYDVFFDGSDFIRGAEVGNGYSVDSQAPFLYVNRHLRLFQAPRLLAAIENHPPWVAPNIVAHIGVPGAGKTYHIINHAQPGDQILAGCRKSVEDAAADLAKKRPGVKIDARTADSYLINTKMRTNTVWLDERYALHAGYLTLIATFSGCTHIHTYGDPKQIPCYSRVKGLWFRYNDMPNASVEYEPVSKRVPVDVARILSPFYTSYGHFRTMNPQRDSLRWQKITSLVDVPVDPELQYLTWTQEEKKTISKTRGFSNVKTIGEAQGTTHKKVAVIRLNPRNLDLYKKQEQAIVALSRHTVSFSYYTVVEQTADKLYYLLTAEPAGRLASFLHPEHFPEDWLRPRAGGVIAAPPRICYRPGALELKEKYLKANGHLFHTARRPLVLRRWDAIQYHAPEPPRRVSPLSCPLAALQRDYNTAMQIPDGYDEKYHNYIIQHGDIEFDIPFSRIKYDRCISGANRILGVEQLRRFSRLRTLQPWPRPATQRQLLLALQKRNCNVGRVAAPSDPWLQADQVVEYFFDTFCKSDWRSSVERFMSDPVGVNPESIDDFLITAETSKIRAVSDPRLRGAIPSTGRLDPYDLDHHQLMFRKEPKNRLAKDSIGEYQILQTVIHHETRVNIICSFFRSMYDRLQSILKPNVFVQLKKSMDDLEKHLNAHVPPTADGFENDFEKFDKSQLEETFAVEMLIYKRLGLDLKLLDLWAFGQTLKTATSLLLGVRVQLLFQRTSGTVVTAFGNVLVNMAATAWAYKLRDTKFHAAYYVGDDSFVFPLTPPNVSEVTQDLRLFFNLLGKVIVGMGNYFCSCFFVHNGRRWLVLPDPIKRIERLSYPLPFTNYADIHDRWVSFCDMCKNYRDPVAIQQLQRQITLRYPGGIIVNAARAIVTLMDSEPEFHRLSYLDQPDRLATLASTRRAVFSTF